MSIIREFHEINGFNNYFVNKDGVIVSKSVGTVIREIRPQIHSSGYLTVKLKSNEESFKHQFVHRIVAKTFIQGEKETVNHKNMDKTDNRVENLEWATRSENCLDFYKQSNKTQKTKCILYKNDINVGEFDSIRKACKYVNDTYESVNINSMSNQLRIGIKPYRGKYRIDRV